MNANELADDLDNANGFQYLAQLGLASQAATMLRQQQAEIEKLKAEIVAIEKNTDYWADKANWIKNNEPVAYVSTTGLNDIEWTDKSHLLNYGDALYTHPVKEPMMVLDGNRVYSVFKELTDEEIHNLFLSFCNVGFTQVDEINFAKAILRKAQEK